MVGLVLLDDVADLASHLAKACYKLIGIDEHEPSHAVTPMVAAVGTYQIDPDVIRLQLNTSMSPPLVPKGVGMPSRKRGHDDNPLVSSIRSIAVDHRAMRPPCLHRPRDILTSSSLDITGKRASSATEGSDQVDVGR